MAIVMTCKRCGFTMKLEDLYTIVKRGHERCLNCGREFCLEDAEWIWERKEKKEVRKDGI
ncbi:MAG: hypothetical protein OCU22_09325 [Canidatus Methanoxibalbensis ujae]|nr:hypothetical protein [Candidatus Methanoxibalbensis ujae]